jgi:CubicO group peptidase (beta-lactamase class C family)
MLRNACLVVVCLACLAGWGCKRPLQLDLNCAGNECLDLSVFSENIQQALNGQVVGYALVLSNGGLVVDQLGWGSSRTSADAPARSMTADERMNIASVNKTITAIAVLRLLAAKQKSLDDAVDPYLPASWSRGPGVGTITFRQLLTHTSGLRPVQCGDAYSKEDYDGLRNLIAAGLNAAPGGGWLDDYCYINANFALFRVIIPYLDGFDDTGVADMASATAAAYLKTVNQEVMAPTGLPPVQCKPRNSPAPPLFYAFPPGGTKGTDFGDWTGTCGGGGLHLSANDLAGILFRVRFTTQLLTPAWRDSMYNGLLGWQNGASNVPVKNGTYHSHGGYLWSPATAGANPGTNCVAGGVREANTVVVDFSVGAQVVLLVNSKVGNQNCIANLQQVVLNAYQAAWKAK